jgi:hypothetical protein
VGIGVHVELKQASEGAAWRRQVTEIVQVSGDAERYVLTPAVVG